MMKNKIHYIRASGTAEEMGYTIGKKQLSNLRELVEENFSALQTIIQHKSLTHLPHSRYLELSKRYLPFAEAYAPELVLEIKSQAKAALVDFSSLLAHNFLLDFDDLAYPFLADQILFGCTSFGLEKSITTTNQAYIGQNYDFRSVFKGMDFLLHLKPNNLPEALIWSMGGVIGCAGINSAGIGVVINNLVPSDSRVGVPHVFIVRKILQQERLGDAVEAVIAAKRSTGINYLLGDSSGQMISLETTATNYEPIYPHNGNIVHSNHYLMNNLRAYERFRLPYSNDSIVRYGRMVKILGEGSGQFDLDSIKSILKDHHNFPYSICRHESENLHNDLIGKTIGSIIINLSSRKMLVASGNPCENEFQEFKFQ
jgi:isopenicillin-N N-acyltransferase-like protein